MNDQKNTAGHMVVWAFLMGILLPMKATSASLEKDLITNADALTLQPYELFARKDISAASSTYGFVTATTEQLDGIANFDKGKLDTNEIFIFNEIKIGYSTGLASGKAAEAAYETKPSAILRNAEFEIRQGSRIVLRLPVASLCNNNTGASVQDDFAILGSLCYLRDDQAFTWSLIFADGVAIPAGNGTSTNSYLEVRLRGHRTIRKA